MIWDGKFVFYVALDESYRCDFVFRKATLWIVTCLVTQFSMKIWKSFANSACKQKCTFSTYLRMQTSLTLASSQYGLTDYKTITYYHTIRVQPFRKSFWRPWRNWKSRCSVWRLAWMSFEWTNCTWLDFYHWWPYQFNILAQMQKKQSPAIPMNKVEKSAWPSDKLTRIILIW